MNRQVREQKSRISFALKSEQIHFPKKSHITLFNPPEDIDTIFTESNKVTIIQNFYPIYKKLLDKGFSVSPKSIGNYKSDICIIFCNRSKNATFNLIYEGLRRLKPTGLIIIDGLKKNGIENIRKEILKLFCHINSISKYHGKLIWFKKETIDTNIERWKFQPRILGDGSITYPGTFSSKAFDPGSVLLGETIPELNGTVADFGSGWGYLSKKILLNRLTSKVDLIEANHDAVTASKENISDKRANFFWDDVNTYKGGPYDTVITNPPFHISREIDPNLGINFIKKANLVLKPNGALWLVANRNLPYEETMVNCFKEVRHVVNQGEYKVLLGLKPS